MPFLDVTDVLLDPLFCETLTIQRRVQNLVKGRTQLVVIAVNPSPVGVVLPLKDAAMEQGADQQNVPRRIEIHTPYRLRSASKKADGSEQYQPDVVVWNGDPFKVDLVDDVSRYGAGWIRAEASSTDPIDNEPV